MVELPVATKFAGGDLRQTVSRKTLGKGSHEVLPISRAIRTVLLKLDDAVSDEPVSQREADVDRFVGKFLCLAMDLGNRSNQRLKIVGQLL